MRKLIIVIGLSLSLVVASAIMVMAENYFVSKEGDDYSDGSEMRPWQTIQRAADTVQPGDTVYIKAGTYIEDVQITTSGEEEKRITFRPYKNDTVTVKAEVGHAFYILGDYITIRGFKIKGAPREIYDPNDPRCPDWTRSGITTRRSYNIFEENEISDCMYGIMIRNRDTSGELAWPSDGYNTVRNNYIHHTDFDALRVKRSNYNVVDNNRFYYNCLKVDAFYNKDGTIRFYLDAPLVFYALKNLKITNNIFLEPKYGPVILEIDMTTRTPQPPSMAPNPDLTMTYLTLDNVIIKNNIGYKTKNVTYPIMLTYGRDFALGTGHIIENNIWYNGKPGSKTVEWGYNFWHDNDQDDGIKPAIWTLNEFQQNTGYENNSRDNLPYTETLYNLGRATQQSKVVDINNDSLLDIVVLVEKAGEGFVRILHQQTDGSLSLSEQEYTIKHGADMINAGDVNNDGLNDIVVTTDDVSANVTAFLYQRPDGIFKLVFKPAPGLPTSAGSPDIGDIDNDGLNDVVRGNKPRGSVSIYYQNASHDLEEPVEIFITGPVKRWRSSDGRIADLNNDGKNDFALRNGVLENGNAFLTVFYNLGNRQFDIVNYDTGISSENGLSDIRIGDLNNDSLTDVVVSVQEGNIIVYLQKNNSLEKNIYSSGLNNIRGIAVGDINNDGRDDIVASSFDGKEGIVILLQKERGIFDTPIRLFSSKGFGGFINVGDVNNDGYMEIIATNGLPVNSISVIELEKNQ